MEKHSPQKKTTEQFIIDITHETLDVPILNTRSRRSIDIYSFNENTDLKRIFSESELIHGVEPTSRNGIAGAVNLLYGLLLGHENAYYINDHRSICSSTARLKEESMKPQRKQYQKTQKQGGLWASLRKVFHKVFHPHATLMLLLSSSLTELQNALSKAKQLVQEGYTLEVKCIGSLEDMCRDCHLQLECQESQEVQAAYRQRIAMVV